MTAAILGSLLVLVLQGATVGGRERGRVGGWSRGLVVVVVRGRGD